jgi:hypothetical protein
MLQLYDDAVVEKDLFIRDTLSFELMRSLLSNEGRKKKSQFCQEILLLLHLDTLYFLVRSSSSSLSKFIRYSTAFSLKKILGQYSFLKKKRLFPVGSVLFQISFHLFSFDSSLDPFAFDIKAAKRF